MTKWLKVDDNFYNHEKFIGIKSGAGWLWIRGLAYCKSHNTDGVIPDAAVRRVLNGNPTQIKALIDAGLWHETQTDAGKKGYLYNDYLDYQTSSAKGAEDKKKGAERTAKWRKNQRDSDGMSAEYQPNSDTISEEYAENHHHPKRSDQQERGNVTPLEKRREEKIRRDESVCLHDRPEGGTHTLKNKNETKDESKEKTTPSRPRNGMDQLAARFPAPRTSSAEVDVSATEDQDTSSWDSRELAIGKPLERMSPGDLLHYIVLSQDEINGIKLSGSGSKGVATMKRFQNQYGPERAAAIMRHLFVKERGKYEVGKNGVEYITQDHFTEPLSWFTDKVDVKVQAKSVRKKRFDSEFIFATEL